MLKLPFAPQYVIAVNGQPATKPDSLKKGDRVTIKRNARIVEVRAERTVDAVGVIEHVHYEPPQTLSVQGDKGQKMAYLG